MQIVNDITRWQTMRNNISTDLKIGFVPTMGCLHQGHASLIKNSVSENDITVLSIFINPTQFNDPADYENYPKTFDSDIAMARNLNVDYVIAPDIDSIYPNGNNIQLMTDHSFSKNNGRTLSPGTF